MSPISTLLSQFELDTWIKLLSGAGTILVWLYDRRRKPDLQAFFGHIAGHNIAAANNLQMNTHSIVLRNAGSVSALNVRITHVVFPPNTDVKLWPIMPYTIIPVPPNGNEFVIERLRPKEQVSINYLYPGPHTADQFGTMVKFDDGPAKWFQAQAVRVLTPAQRAIVWYLVLAGVFVSIYVALRILIFAIVVT